MVPTSARVVSLAVFFASAIIATGCTPGGPGNGVPPPPSCDDPPVGGARLCVRVSSNLGIDICELGATVVHDAGPTSIVEPPAPQCPLGFPYDFSMTFAADELAGEVNPATLSIIARDNAGAAAGSGDAPLVLEVDTAVGVGVELESL